MGFVLDSYGGHDGYKQYVHWYMREFGMVLHLQWSLKHWSTSEDFSLTLVGSASKKVVLGTKKHARLEQQHFQTLAVSSEV